MCPKDSNDRIERESHNSENGTSAARGSFPEVVDRWLRRALAIGGDGGRDRSRGPKVRGGGHAVISGTKSEGQLRQFEDVDIWDIPVAFVVIKPVADNKEIFNFGAEEGDVDLDLPP